MVVFFRVMGWGLLGFLIAGALALATFIILNYEEILGPKDADEVQAWARFAAMMGSLSFAMVGFVLGDMLEAIYGIVRGRERLRPQPDHGVARETDL